MKNLPLIFSLVLCAQLNIASASISITNSIAPVDLIIYEASFTLDGIEYYDGNYEPSSEAFIDHPFSLRLVLDVTSDSDDGWYGNTMTRSVQPIEFELNNLSMHSSTTFDSNTDSYKIINFGYDFGPNVNMPNGNQHYVFFDFFDVIINEGLPNETIVFNGDTLYDTGTNYRSGLSIHHYTTGDNAYVYKISESFSYYEAGEFIPEPSTYALIFGGLALGFVAIRRK